MLTLFGLKGGGGGGGGGVGAEVEVKKKFYQDTKNELHTTHCKLLRGLNYCRSLH